MSTIYVFHQECPTISGVAAGDMILVYDTSTGRTCKATVAQMTGGGAVLSGRDTTASTTVTGQSSFTHTITLAGVTVGDVVIASLENGTNTTGIGVIRSLTAGAGIITAIIANAATTATNPFGGTFMVNYMVRSAS